MLRGNNGLQIFGSDHDRLKMCSLLKEGIQRFGHSIHGFCFMSNHIHLIVQTSDIPLSIVIKHLAAGYAQYMNNKYDRIGHLFQGRFKSILINEEGYINELIRYVHLNPVRAGIVTWPENYHWSSHRTYIGIKDTPWISQEWILQKLHPDIPVARKLFDEFVKKGIGVEVSEEFKIAINQGLQLKAKKASEEDFGPILQKQEVQNIFSLEEIITAVSNVLGLTLSEIKSSSTRIHITARGITALMVKKSPQLTLQSLAIFLNKDQSVLSRAALSLELKMDTDVELAKLINRINDHLVCSLKPCIPICT